MSSEKTSSSLKHMKFNPLNGREGDILEDRIPENVLHLMKMRNLQVQEAQHTQSTRNMMKTAPRQIRIKLYKNGHEEKKLIATKGKRFHVEEQR